MYETVDEAKMRLGNCVVMYRGRPVFVETCYDGAKDNYVRNAHGEVEYDENGAPKKRKRGEKAGFLARCYMLPKQNEKRDIGLDEDGWEVRNFNLGYCNTPQGAVYLQRMPVRKYKQGLCNENINVKASEMGYRLPSWINLIWTEQFADMMLGKYPTFDEAKKKLEADPALLSVAFERRFALSRDKDFGFFVLQHRGNRIAWGDPDALVLPSEHERLRELMTELGIQSR